MLPPLIYASSNAHPTGVTYVSRKSVKPWSQPTTQLLTTYFGGGECQVCQGCSQIAWDVWRGWWLQGVHEDQVRRKQGGACNGKVCSMNTRRKKHVTACVCKPACSARASFTTQWAWNCGQIYFFSCLPFKKFIVCLLFSFKELTFRRPRVATVDYVVNILRAVSGFQNLQGWHALHT